MSTHCAGRDMSAAIELNRQWARLAFGPNAAAPAAPDRLIVVHEDSPGDTKVGRCAFGGPLRIYPHGIGVNSLAILRVSLGRAAERLKATIGLDRNVDGTPASVRFHAKAGEQSLFSTGVIRPGAAPRDIDVPLGEAREVDLIVDDGGDGRGWDQGEWADARVCFADGTEVYLDDLAGQAIPVAGLPFSFVYGGKPSAEFLDAAVAQRQHLRHGGRDRGHHHQRRGEGPAHERRAESLSALQHRRPDGRVAVLLPQRLQRRH